jgi:hypothetical protein
MSQNDLVIANQTFPATRADINNALQALGSNNSGPTAPSTTYANMMWYDTTSHILKLRAEANDVWINIGYVDQSSDTFKILDDTIVATTAGATTGLLGDQATGVWEAGTGTTESLVSPAKIKASVIANAPSYTQPTSVGAVGTYAWLRFNSDIGGAGSTHAGSGLIYAGITDSVGNNIVTIYSGSPAGTWRLMGHGNGGFPDDKTSLFLRIS